MTPQPPTTFFFKHAGARAAYATLGLEKTALAAPLLGLGKGLLGGLGAVGKGMYNVGAKAYRGVENPLTNVFSRTGHGALNMLERTGVSTKLTDPVRGLGTGLLRGQKAIPGKNYGIARDMAGFGLLGGGIEAALADPGDRLKGFGRGFAGGALGGLGWGIGRNVTRGGLQKGLGATRWQQLQNQSQDGLKGWFGQGFKGFGANMVTKGLPFAGAIGASHLATPTFGGAQQAPPYTAQALYAPFDMRHQPTVFPRPMSGYRYY